MKNKMNREELIAEIKSKFNLRFTKKAEHTIFDIAEQYAGSKVSELRKSAEENENLLRDRKNQHIEVLKAENEKLKSYLKANSLLLTQREKMFVSPHDGTITEYNGQSVYQEVKAGHLYCPNVVEGGKIEIIEIKPTESDFTNGRLDKDPYEI